MASRFEQIGGEARLRAIIDRFLDRVFADPMIGFLFAGVDQRRVRDKEYEFAAAHLGADVKYTGRPLPQAHRPHPVLEGHFMRRLQLLEETLAEFELPPDVVEHWVTHTQRLKSSVTQPGDCRSARSVEPTARAWRPLPLVGARGNAPATAQAEPESSPASSDRRNEEGA